MLVLCYKNTANLMDRAPSGKSSLTLKLALGCAVTLCKSVPFARLSTLVRKIMAINFFFPSKEGKVVIISTGNQHPYH